MLNGCRQKNSLQSVQKHSKAITWMMMIWFTYDLPFCSSVSLHNFTFCYIKSNQCGRSHTAMDRLYCRHSTIVKAKAHLILHIILFKMSCVRNYVCWSWKSCAESQYIHGLTVTFTIQTSGINEKPYHRSVCTLSIEQPSMSSCWKGNFPEM